MPTDPDFTIIYWGVTGSFSAPLLPSAVAAKVVQTIERLASEGRLAQLAHLAPGPGLREAIEREVASVPLHVRSTYGGNTTCVEVQTSDGLFILDCGGGGRELGLALQRRWNAPGYTGSRSAHVLVSHPHMDHTYAMPFFGPFYDPRNHFTLWGTRTVIDSLQAVLSPESVLSKTYFPPTFDMMKAIGRFEVISPGQEVCIGATRIGTFALCHPGGCLAYRLEHGGKAFVFATDHEQPHVPDMALAEFARGADLLYTEGQYTQAEYDGREALPGDAPAPRRGWGHSPVEACVRTALAAGVRRLHVGHRDPLRGDADIARLEAYCRDVARDELRRLGRDPEAFPFQVAIPHEGLTIHL
jgi:phosphoribosyl 1,2-cyclic phosphodiesterase